MRNVSIILCALTLNSFVALNAQPDMPDSTFNADGIASADINASSLDHGLAVLIQPDGKIVVGGYTFSTGEDLALARFTSNGSLDPTFSSDGKTFTDLGTEYDRIHSLARQPDGKIVAAGYMDIISDRAFALARYVADGSADLTFNTTGWVRSDVGAGWSAANAVVVQPDGKILAGGLSGNFTTSFFALVRFNSDGSPDNTFGTSGKVQTPVGAFYDGIQAITLQPDGKIVAVGYSLVSDYDAAIVRYHANGDADSTFGTNGIVSVSLGVDDDRLNAVALQPDGKIVVAGFAINAIGAKEFLVARFNANGSLDNTFGTGGKTTTDVGTADDAGLSLSIDTEGRIVVVGDARITNADFGMARYLSDGTLDDGFSDDGKLSFDVSGSHDGAAAVAHQADGKIVAAGYATVSLNEDFAVVRYMAGWGVGILEFTRPGSVLINPNPIESTAHLKYTLLSDEAISIVMYDITGRLVKVFRQADMQSSGEHTQVLEFPDGLSAGNYLVSISSPSGQVSIKVVKR